MEELDEFGIPIKKADSQPTVDEFGIPVKKKDVSKSTSPVTKSVSATSIGSSDGIKKIGADFKIFPDGEIKTDLSKQPLPKINKKLKSYIDTNKSNLERKSVLENELKAVKVTSENQDEISKKTDELSKLTKQTELNKELIAEIASRKTNYNKISSLTNKLSTGSSQLGADIASIPEFVYDVFAIPQNAVADIFDLPSLKADSEKFKKTIGVNNSVKDYYKEEVSKLKENAQKTDIKYSQGVYDSFVSGDYAGGFDQLTNSFAESLPVTASIMVGGAYAKAPQLIASSSMLFGAGKNEKLKDENPEMNNNTRVANALMTGIIQGATETLGTGSIGASAKALVEREGAERAVSILKDGLVKYYKSALSKNPLLASMSGEGLEEAFQGVAENAVDVSTGVKPKYYNIYSTMADDFIGGAFGGSVFGAGLKGLNQVTNYQDKNIVKSNNKKIFNLQNELSNPEIPSDVRVEINNNIDGLIKQNRNLISKSVSHVEGLSENVRNKLIESISIIEDAKQKSEQIKSNQDISIETKKTLLDNLKTEYKKAQGFKNDILEGNISEVDVLPLKEQDKLKRQASKELIEELNPDGTKNIKIDNNQITERANKIYSKQLKDAETESAIAETESQIEVQKPADETQEIEEVANEAVSTPDVVVNENIQLGNNGDLQQQETETIQPTTIARESEVDVEVKKPEKYEKDSFESSANIVPNGEVGEYLSGKTIEKYTGDKPENNQEILKVKLEEALIHGVSTIDKAIAKFGDDFVSKTLEHLDSPSISPEAKALTYISLENELVKRQKGEFKDDLTIRKQLDMVRAKRQAFARSNSLALNMNRLQKFAEIGFDINSMPEKLFSVKQKEAKSKIEDSIQHTSADINKQDDLEQSESITPEIKDLIQEGIDKQINEIYNKLPTNRKIKADKAIKALENIQKNIRSKTYDASIGIPVALIDAGITVIKNSIKAGVNIVDAIELGISHIKDKYGKEWDKEDDFRKDFIKGFESENIDLKEKIKADESIKGIVKQALIDAGYYREVTINGEKVKRLDWIKLAGEEGSVENIKNKVEEVLMKKGGYSKKQISEMKTALEEEYNRLGAEIIQKGLNELEKRNLIKPSPKRKTEAKRLSELYNFGLLDKNSNEYDNLLNKILGLSDFEQKIFDKIKAKTKALADIFNSEVGGKKITEQSLQSIANDLNHEIKELLNAVSYKEGDFKYKIATLLTDYAGLSQKALLGGLPNLIENITSGRFAGLEQKVYTDSSLTPELKKQIKADKKIIYDDITKNAGLYYGDTNTSLVSSSRFEDWVNGKTDNRMAHAVISAITLRSWLDGADSRAKVGLSSKLFIKNAVEILSSPTNPNGAMSKEDAIKFVSESLTGDNFEKALETAKSIIDDVNSKQEGKPLRDNKEAIHRFAMNLVKENLMQDNRMTMEQIDNAFKSGYKSAGRDIGHEANNPISKGVNLLNASINSELEKAVSEKRYGEATALASKLLVMRTIVNPFVGGGTNWIVLGLEKSGNPLGYISTLFNKAKQTELDLGTISGIKNMSESLYRKNNYQASLTRNIIGTSVALAMFAGASIDGEDGEDGIDKLNKWLKSNKWASKYFEKLAPESLVFMIALENQELGKHLAKTLGMNGDTFNNTSKLLKSLDKEDTSTSGKVGQVVGAPLNSPLAWKTVKDIQNIIRGVKGEEEYKTDYNASGFWNGYFQGGLTEFLGMRPNSENTTSSKGAKVNKKKFKKYKKY